MSTMGFLEKIVEELGMNPQMKRIEIFEKNNFFQNFGKKKCKK